MAVDAVRLEQLSATDAARAVREGAISAEDLMQACLARVREVDPDVQAWHFLDPEHALAQARARDQDRKEGRPCGPLHGVPVGIKDVIDTMDMPTEDGTVLHAGRLPDHDATVVSLLRAAGAVIMGKTVTTECANNHPGKTRNPHNIEHTPGGSSSGSAAAVAAAMVPIAIGTQTNGSVIRPAAFCGTFGFKPTHGLVSRHGILRLSRTLDHVGVFARTLEDIALVAENLAVHDERDPDTRPRAAVPFSRVMSGDPPLPPRFALVKTPHWDGADAELREGFDELVSFLGAQCGEFELPGSSLAAWDWHATIMHAEMAANLAREWDEGRERLSDSLQDRLSRGRAVSALDYQKALARVPVLNEAFDDVFENFDAVLTPSAAGTAPRGLASTGDPSFCTLWTLCGMPSITLPLMTGANGLPMGVQLVARRGDDARLLRTARWLLARVREE